MHPASLLMLVEVSEVDNRFILDLKEFNLGGLCFSPWL